MKVRNKQAETEKGKERSKRRKRNDMRRGEYNLVDFLFIENALLF